MNPRLFAFAAFLLPLVAKAAPTPLDLPLAEEKEATIECELTQNVPHSSVPVFSSPKDSESAKGTYHYKLWLPKGYLADPQRCWPCMFIMSPGGNASMGSMAARLKSDGFVVVMFVEAKNGPWPPIVGNFLSAHDDVIKRVRIQEGLKFATGFSGGARGSSLLVQLRPGFTGVICQGAGFFYDDKKKYYVAGVRKIPGFAVALTMGDKDNNSRELGELKSALGPVPLHEYPFAGTHQPAPADVFNEALTWVEQQVYVEGPTRAELMPVYLNYFKQHADALNAATSAWEKFKIADSMLTFARARNLTMNTGVAAQIRELQALVLQLKSDPVVAREHVAADALQRLDQSDKNLHGTKVSADYRDFAKHYAGTEAAKTAEQKASENAP